MDEDPRAPRRRSVERAALVMVAVFAAGAGLVRPVWSRLDPAQAIADAAWDGAKDPWDQHLRADGRLLIYSTGPDGIDQGGGGDDVYPADKGAARFMYRASRLVLAFAAVAVLALAASLRQTRGSWLVEGVLALFFGFILAFGALVLFDRLEADGLIALHELTRTWIHPMWAVFISATTSGAMLLYLARVALAPARETNALA